MKVLFPLLLVLLFTACEHQPTPEEIEQQRLTEAEAAQRKATPKPGEWMFKNYKNPLEKPKH